MKLYFPILLLIALLFITGCSEENHKNCNGNPLQDLEWLKTDIERFKKGEQDDAELSQYFYISQGVYKGETVFLYENCCPHCNSVIPVFNCKGENIGHLNSAEEKAIDQNQITHKKIIWRPSKFQCEL